MSRRNNIIVLPSAFDPLNYNPLAIWDSDNVTLVSGAVDVATDYSGNGYDISAPAASNRPSYTAADADFNGKPSVTFNGLSQYLLGAYANFLGSEQSGEVVMVVRCIDDTIDQFLFNTSDQASGTRAIRFGVSNDVGGDVVKYIQHNNDTAEIIRGTPTKAKGFTAVIGFRSNGSAYGFRVDGTDQTVAVDNGANNGDWFADTANRDNVTLGALVRNTINYYAFDWAFTGIYPLLSTADRTALFTGLANRYK